MYKDVVEANQLKDLLNKYVAIYEKQEQLKQEKAELNKYTKALGYHPTLIAHIMKRQYHPNAEKLKKEDELLSLYTSALNI